MKKIIIILFLLLVGNLFAESKITIAPYLSYASYEGNVINNDTLVGFYSLFDWKDYSLEFSAESKNLKYTNGSSLKQRNYIASYKTYLKSNMRLNTLVHYVLNNDNASNGTTSFLVGINYKTKNKITYTLQSAYSLYNTQALANKYLQIKPSVGYIYGHKDSNYGQLFPKISFYYIMPFSPNAALDTSYFSTEIDLVHVKNAFRTKGSIWFGKQINALRDNGFTIYNLKQIHTSGFTLSSRYKLNKDTGLTLSYSNEYYNMIGNSKQLFYNRLLFVADFNY